MASILEESKQFVISRVVEPALASPKLSKKSKERIKRTKLWVSKCREVGDIYDYISRYRGESEKTFRDVYVELRRLSMTTVEDVIQPFAAEFEKYLDQRLELEDLQKSATYSSWDISILSKTYNEQQGIYLIQEEGAVKAILTKVTLEDGVYKNEWLDSNTLKHYMKSRSGVYDEKYVVNKAIIESRGSPIYVFIKSGTACVYDGIFRFTEKGVDPDGAKWFKLNREESLEVVSETLDDCIEKLEKDIFSSGLLTEHDRMKAIALFPKHPIKKLVKAAVFERNPHVIQEALKRANGICQLCKEPAPFNRKSDNKPFLEVHHRIQLSKGGEDTIENTIAVCPNCHRREHFG